MLNVERCNPRECTHKLRHQPLKCPMVSSEWNRKQICITHFISIIYGKHTFWRKYNIWRKEVQHANLSIHTYTYKHTYIAIHKYITSAVVTHRVQTQMMVSSNRQEICQRPSLSAVKFDTFQCYVNVCVCVGKCVHARILIALGHQMIGIQMRISK